MDYYSDRSWMRWRKSSAQIGATAEFRTNCQVFLDYAYSHPECVNGQNKIRCPCLKCKNVNYMDRDMVAYHLLVKGFMNNYEDCWWAHGQRRDSGIAQVHNPGSNTHRMNDMVHDIAGPDFDWEQDREQVMNSDAKAFFKLLDEGSELVWPGCTKQTTLSAVATLLNIKADHNMSHECFESLLKAIKSMLPDGEKLPDNYYFCKKMVKKLGLGYQKIDACPNDYHPFRRNRENFRKGKVENDMLAPRLSGTGMFERVMRLPVIQFGKIATSEIINGFGDSQNWVRRSIFWELPYWSTNLIRHNLDVMHIEKNVFDNVFSTVMGVPGKTKDNDKAWLDMKDICKHPGLELYGTPNDYFPDEVLTKANRVPRHDDGGNVELNGRLSVFGLPGRAYGKGKRIFLFEQELHAAHTYILFNCKEIDDFVRSYDDELKANQSGITDKDIQLSRDQSFALWLKDKNAQIDHPGQAEEYMHEYNPWWCAPTIWAGMCEQWKAESWVKRCRAAAMNRASGAPEGNKAPGMYKGGNISQLQHVAASEASSQGQPIHWLDVYVETRDGLPEAVQIVETYNTLMDERYPEGTSQPPIDQELWERASVFKKNYVKGQGQR
ncbi:hypothetical protein MRB53_034911 [Persea americana]|uniref:Uncharacterized protein n=1 Tax=Persea americana TaxID=3435 RepID=A0ACC2K3E0_PERAE|nr:hypothetical protein MRB53_034911 [Persea americana]